ncbi:MAG TPA: XdhC family protein [Micromonospora sp.]
MTEPDASCGVAHGEVPAGGTARAVVAVFASPVSAELLHLAGHTGFRALLVEPDPVRRPPDAHPTVASALAAVGDDVDVVVTDHHRPELGELLRDALAGRTRWIGLMGNPRHAGPHVAALAELGVPPAEVARVHRPIGLNLGSRTPGEIAVATLAGLIADRNGRPGGFTHTPAG